MSDTDTITLMKQAVGRVAAARVKSDSVVGLGTGSTTAYAIQYIGERLQKGEIKNIVGIPTSFQAEVLAKQYNIPLTSLDAVDHIDIAIDGADEVDPDKHMIKGGGAALTREKIIASVAEQFICMVDPRKCVDVLGEFPLPVEIVPMAAQALIQKIKTWGGQAKQPGR